MFAWLVRHDAMCHRRWRRLIEAPAMRTEKFCQHFYMCALVLLMPLMVMSLYVLVRPLLWSLLKHFSSWTDPNELGNVVHGSTNSYTTSQLAVLIADWMAAHQNVYFIQTIGAWRILSPFFRCGKCCEYFLSTKK